MKHIAIISDIHANLEALVTILADIRHRNVDAVYCLGDTIGYGPDPVQCLTTTLDVCDFLLMGNHEEAVLTGAFGFNPSAKEAIDWTRRQLKPKWWSPLRVRQQWEILKSLPLCYAEDDFLFVHGSPRDPTMEYILKSDTEDLFGDVPEKIDEIFQHFDRACFIGHTHAPGIITEDNIWYSPQEFDGVWEFKNGKRFICNIGSAGQPRDKDTRGSYVTCTEQEVFFHRIPYDFRKTQSKIRRIMQLDNRNANRLETGN